MNMGENKLRPTVVSAVEATNQSAAAIVGRPNCSLNAASFLIS